MPDTSGRPSGVRIGMVRSVDCATADAGTSVSAKVIMMTAAKHLFSICNLP
jgi:hypothetical protein